MCIEVNKNIRWGGVKKKILQDVINVSFTERHGNYVTAFRYVNKSGAEPC